MAYNAPQDEDRDLEQERRDAVLAQTTPDTTEAPAPSMAAAAAPPSLVAAPSQQVNFAPQGYDPNQLNPLQVPGQTWASMAPALIPTLIGAIVGRGGALAGLQGGAGAIDAARQHALEYNNQLAEVAERQRLAREESARQEREMQLREEEAGRQKQLFPYTLAEAKDKMEQLAKTRQGQATLMQTIKDPNQRLMFQAYPEQMVPFLMHNLEVDEQTHQNLAALNAGTIKLPSTMPDTPANREAFARIIGPKLADMLMEKDRLQNSLDVARIHTAPQWARLQFEQAERLQPHPIPGTSYFYQTVPDPDHRGKYKIEVHDFGEPGFQTPGSTEFVDQRLREARTKELLTQFDKGDITFKTKYNNDPMKYIASPEGQAYIQWGGTPAFGGFMTDLVRNQKAMEDTADQRTRKYWADNVRGSIFGRGEDDYQKWKTSTTQGQNKYNEQLLMQQAVNSGQRLNPTPSQLAPPAAPGARPSPAAIMQQGAGVTPPPAAAAAPAPAPAAARPPTALPGPERIAEVARMTEENRRFRSDIRTRRAMEEYAAEAVRQAILRGELP